MAPLTLTAATSGDGRWAGGSKWREAVIELGWQGSGYRFAARSNVDPNSYLFVYPNFAALGIWYTKPVAGSQLPLNVNFGFLQTWTPPFPGGLDVVPDH